VSEIAHLGPVELLTPSAELSLAFFVDVLGMEIEGRDGGSVYLRGWGDYQRYSLVLSESAQPGMAWLGLRASSQAALERRVATVAASGLGEGWSEGARGRGPSYGFRDPDGHRFELYYECDRYEARSSASITSTSWLPTCAPAASSLSRRSATVCTSASNWTTAARLARGLARRSQRTS
jgi:catechol 2,3-dioxygenase-like lactoylglutathione lyase family enzyme